MRIRFQERPWDVWLSISYSVGGCLFIALTGSGSLLLLPAAAFVPGYLVLAALYPSEGGLSWPTRLVLSAALSIAIVPLLGLALNYTPMGVTTLWSSVFITAFAIGTGGAALRRRLALPASKRLSLSIETKLLSHSDFRRAGIVGLTLLVASAASAGVLIGFFLALPTPQERFTEFYVTPGNGATFPSSLNISQNMTVILGLANHELQLENYSVRVDLVGLKLQPNTSTGQQETIEVNRTTIGWFNVSLVNGGNWNQQFSFSINKRGTWKIEFLLFRDRLDDAPYRKLQLFITTSTP